MPIGETWTLRELTNLVQKKVAGKSRFILGICGPPGSGKSTLTEALCKSLGASSVHVPMDGFHLAQVELERLGRAERKGAPDTFDADGFRALLQRLRASNGSTVYAPEFRREIEEPVAGAIAVPPDVKIVIVEGNYLLSEDEGWSGLGTYFDEIWYLDVNHSTQERRLIDRQMCGGRSLEDAREWAAGSDYRNGEYVRSTAHRADFRIGSVALEDTTP